MGTNGLAEGTRVRVIQEVQQADPPYEAETVGVIEAWEDEPTGAWFAGGPEGRLLLKRLRLQKADGEVSVLTLDKRTRVLPIESDVQQMAALEVCDDVLSSGSNHSTSGNRNGRYSVRPAGIESR